MRIGRIGDFRMISMMDRGFIVEPCICLTEDRLMIAMSPEALRQSISGDQPTPLFADELVSQFQRVGHALDGETLVGAGYVDMKTLLQFVYPLARAGLSTFKGEALRELTPNPGPDELALNIVMHAELPPLRTLLQHMEPGIFAFRTSPTGTEIELKHSLPLPDVVGTLVASGLLSLPLMPATGNMQSVELENDLRSIAIASWNHESVFKRMPADITDEAGNPLLSWRVRLLPFLEQAPLHDQIRMDEPWDSEHNRQFHERIPAVYQSAGLAKGKTTIRGFGGASGLFSKPKGIRITDVRDGLSNTLMFAKLPDAFAVNWMKPGPLEPNDMNLNSLFGDSKKLVVAFADGSVHRLPRTIGERDLNRLIQINDGEIMDWDPFGENETAIVDGAFSRSLKSVIVSIYENTELISSGRTPRDRVVFPKELDKEESYEYDKKMPPRASEKGIEKIE